MDRLDLSIARFVDSRVTIHNSYPPSRVAPSCQCVQTVVSWFRKDRLECLYYISLLDLGVWSHRMQLVSTGWLYNHDHATRCAATTCTGSWVMITGGASFMCTLVLHAHGTCMVCMCIVLN